jgi:hypothetical protein
MLDDAGNLKGLLFEKGKPLELAILEALRTIGFQAAGLVDEESEFDAVFVDPSGRRLLGEAEGKDDKAINIEKLDQLNRNIQEDYGKRPDSTDYAKGVLFGNAFRLSPPAERGSFFTPKCLAGAKRLGAALVRTPSMRRPVGVKWILLSICETTFVLPPSGHCRHASIRTLEERFSSLGACWAFLIQPVLPSVWRPVVLLLQSGTWARRSTQSPELGFGL